MVVTYLTRQREVAISLFDNYDKALKLENSALNSNGKAMQKYQVYQDSIAAKQERITALFQTFVQNVDLEYIVGKLLDLGEALMKVFSNDAAVNIGKATAAVIIFTKAIKSVLHLMEVAASAGGIAGAKDIFALFGLSGLSTVIPLIVATVAAITALVYIVDKLHHSAA